MSGMFKHYPDMDVNKYIWRRNS